MRVFLDTNVLIDLLMRREPFVNNAERVFLLAGTGQIEALVSALTLVNAHYILSKTSGRKVARRALRVIVSDLTVYDLTWSHILTELSGEDFDDFEDGLQFRAAFAAEAEVIVTRDLDDFKPSGIPVMTPERFLSFNTTRMQGS